jgi:ATP-binding cassette subfamily B protein
MPATSYNQLTLYRRVLLQARPYWLHLLGTLVLSLVSTALALLAPLPMKLAVDSVIGSQPIPGFLRPLAPRAGSGTPLLLFVVGVLLAITLLRQVQGVASGVLYTYTSEALLQDFRAKLFRHVQRLSLSYHDNKGTSDSSYRIQYDSPCVQALTLGSILPMITSSVTLVGMIFVIARMDWQLALVALGVSPFLFALSRIFRRPLRRRWKEVKKLDSSAISVVNETLSAIRVVKAFGRETHEHDRFLDQSRRRIARLVRITFLQGGFDMLVGLTTAAGTSAALFIGVTHVRSGVLTLGGLLVTMSYLAQLYSPLSSLSKLVTDRQSGLASAERVFALFDEIPEVIERPQARPLLRATGGIAFRDVDFSYDGTSSILHGISFEIPPGTRVGISGETGAGKTTLVSLLMRFYDPTAGKILLDGVDLRDYKLADLRNQFALVLQEPVLFSDSIAQNIAYARPDATEKEIVEAAKLANAHDFIVRLPKGYQTLVGERGMRLSGGERQRVSLARAFLKDAPILLLDEPTSSVDVKTEAGIMEAIDRLMHGRTAVMIAHRLSTLDICDMRIEIVDGKIIRPPATFKYDGVRSVDREGRLISESHTFPGEKHAVR